MPVASPSFLSRLRSRSRTGWIGIDIGSYSIKLAQLEIVDGQKQIAEAAIIPISDAGLLTAESLQTGWLTRALRNELTHHRGFRGKNAACGLSMSVTEFRSMNIPVGTTSERRSMIAQELAESGGAGPDVEFDYWDGYTSPTDTANVDATVNVLSVSEDLATQVAESIQEVGLHCQVLDAGPFALTRSVKLINDGTSSEKPLAVLDWGHHAAHFAVIVHGEPVFSRVLKDCGAGTLVAAVGRGLGLAAEDCHQLLSTCGVPNPYLDHSERTELQELVTDFAGEIFHQLIVELDKTLSYLKSQRRELVPDELVLVGGGATIRNVDMHLSFETGMTISPWRPLRRVTARAMMEGQSVELLAQAAALSELGWPT